MNDLKQAMLGVMAVLLLGLIVLGSLALAMVEDRALLAELPDQVMDIGQPAPSAAIVFRPNLDQPSQSSVSPASPGSASDFFAASAADEIRASYACDPPAGWTLYVIKPDDTLTSLSLRFKITPEEFAGRNCLNLLVTALPSGATVFVPRLEPTSVVAAVDEPAAPSESKKSAVAGKQKPAKCGPPSWWVIYRVQRGDTLSRLSALTGASVAELQRANCLGGSTIIRVGQTLYLPGWPVAAVVPTRPRQPTAAPAHPTEQQYPTLPYPTSPYGTPRPTATPAPPRATATSYPTLPPTQPPTAQPTEKPTQPPPTEIPPTEPPPPTQVPPTEPPPTQVPPTEPPPPTQVPPTEPPPPTQVPPTEPPPPTQVPPTEPPPPTQVPPTEPPPEDTTSPNDAPQADLFTHILALPWYDPIVRLVAILNHILIG